MDNRVAEALVQGTPSQSVTDFIQAVDENVATTDSFDHRYRRQASGTMTCMECEASLKAVMVEGIEIDICETHGAFFDHREVRSYLFEKATRQAGVAAQQAQTAAAHAHELRAFKHDLGEMESQTRRRMERRHPGMAALLDLYRAWKRPK